jgi:hypothetical protein
MRLPALIAVLALAVGPSRAHAGQDVPAIDALVAGRLALAAAAIDAGRTPEAEGTREMLERPQRLHAALCSVLEHGSWRSPGNAATPWFEHRLQDRHRPYVRELAAALPAADVLQAAREDLAAGASPARMRARLVLSGEAARARDVRLLGALALAAGGRDAASEYGRALAATLRRDEKACHELDAAWKDLEPGLRLAALDALAECARPEAMPVLAARLDDQPDLRLAVLARIGALAQRIEQPADPRTAAEVRTLLHDARTHVRREAALCAGRLEDAEAAERLVELLEARERAEREAAHWALRRISRLGFSGDPRPWRLWLADELRWWQERWPQCRTALADPHGTDALAALDEAARRRLHRDELARAVVEMGGVEGELALRRVHVLGALASRAGLDFLRECLEHGDGPLRQAAADAWSAACDLPLPGAGPAAGTPR